jgi:hypothetical protein
MASFPEESVWEFKCPFRKVWVEVKPDEDVQLKAAYLKCSKAEPEASYLVNGVRFKADFSSLVRTNIASQRTMELRLRGGALPSPPPEPAPGKPKPSTASRGAAAEEDGKMPPLSPETLSSCDTKPVPHSIRKAWGQGAQPGVTMTQEFEFTMQVEDKDFLGEMLTWNMLKAGIPPEALVPWVLFFIDKTGQVVTNDKQAVERMLSNRGSYPIKVQFKPPFHLKGMGPEMIPSMQIHRTQLGFCINAQKACDNDIKKVKHWHQRRTFERYQLYLEDHKYQCADDLADAPSQAELYAQYPHLTGALGLIDKTGPNLVRVMKGDADVLEYLFGG